MKTRSIVQLGLLTATAMILHTAESWVAIPSPVPGIKLGLANSVSLFALAVFGMRAALYITFTRIFLGSIVGGVFIGPAFALSAAGGLGSILLMGWVCRSFKPPLSVIGASVIGAAAHSFIQVLTAAVLVSSISLLWYIPYVVLLAIPMGLVTGYTSGYFMGRMPPQ